LPIEYCYYLV
jgi:hypothetical protein